MSSKISNSKILGWFNLMLKEHWSYGTDTKYGQVDCSGAFVYAYKQEGHSIYHGSNRIARTEVLKLYPIGEVDIVPGMAAFKHRTPLDSAYALPSSYKNGGAYYNSDLNDYYHIGLVGEDTTKVLNAQSSSTGFVSSDISKGWTHVAYLTQVEYGVDEEEIVPDIPSLPDLEDNDPLPSMATVVAQNGTYVKMRQKPLKTCNLWWKVPINSVVSLTGRISEDWTEIIYGSRSGWMMSEYLEVNDIPNIEPVNQKYSVTIVDLTTDEADKLMNQYNGRSFLDLSNG